MFTASETGPDIHGNQVRLRIDLPGIEQHRGFSVKAYIITKQSQFDANVPAAVYHLKPIPPDAADDNCWGDIDKTRWQSDRIALSAGTYLYRFEITGPGRDGGQQTRSLFFGDPCARETDAGVFSVFHMPHTPSPAWTDDAYTLPPLEEIILYELNVAEFGGDFKGIAHRIPYLLSLGVNAIELLPINSIAEPNRWGYMPIFYFAPEERFGGPAGLRHLVSQCHAAGIAVVLDMVYAHTDRMFPYQIGYERFFHLWQDDHYTDDAGTHRAPNPLVCAYDNFGRKNDWRMASTHEFFAAVNAFWLEQYHIDGFRYDHVNGYLDRSPTIRDDTIDWYSQENRPTFESLKELTHATYAASKNHSRFMPVANQASRIIQIAEDLRESAFQLSPIAASAVNGNWEKRLADLAQHMAATNSLSPDIGKELLLSDERFDNQGYTGQKRVGTDTIPALVVQFIESHDENRLFYLMQHGENHRDAGYAYRNGLDEQPWWRLQPYAIALLTSVGMPMLWAGQEFAENTGLAEGGMARVRGLRPLHWDYFYNVAATHGGATVLPLVALYRKLGQLRKDHPALRGPRENAKAEYSNTTDRLIVYRRWRDNEVIIVALNFSDHQQHVPIPFGHTGTWVDVLDAAYNHAPFERNVVDPNAHEWVPIPSHFGRMLRLK